MVSAVGNSLLLLLACTGYYVHTQRKAWEGALVLHNTRAEHTKSIGLVLHTRRLSRS